jgi:acyl-coenzyme A synthetase/AMP-(fatty) acid ligase
MPVSVEFEIEEIPEIQRAAAVGVGPAGLQQIVAVIEVLNSSTIIQAAPMSLVTKIRSITSSNIAAVLTVKRLPVDRRHNSKIDRVLVKLWADKALSGEKVRTK